MTTPRIWVANLTFSDDTQLAFAKDDIVVIVGPNNAGKSAILKGIHDKVYDPQRTNKVIKKVDVHEEGEIEDVFNWLETNARRNDANPSDPFYGAYGLNVHRSQAQHVWASIPSGLQSLGHLFCRLLTADDRLSTSNPAGNIAITAEPIQHPIQSLLKDDSLEERLSKQFRRAFGSDLVVHRNAGSSIPLHVGQRPVPAPGKDRLSYEYIQEIEKLPALHTQGDGMRSYVGVLLHTSVGRESILLIDEPEAFLHPPQARQLGRMLVAEKPQDRQLFIATHSGDVLRGVLDSNSPNVRVVRIRRDGDVNRVRELRNEQVAELWNDPLLRYSNILDGLFHEKVVLGESDSDCRFYAAITDVACGSESGERTRPAVMFTHCGGKARLPMVLRALRNLDVPVACVTDFDVLSDEQPLRAIVEAAGGDWGAVSADWKLVKTSIDSKKPELNAEEVTRDIQGILGGISETIFPAAAKRQIQAVLRRSSPWSHAKSVGKAFVPSGDPTQAYNRLILKLREYGIFVVEVGELEGFARSVGNHGPTWVNQVLQKDLKSDPELIVAREFVSALVCP